MKGCAGEFVNWNCCWSFVGVLCEGVRVCWQRGSSTEIESSSLESDLTFVTAVTYWSVFPPHFSSAHPLLLPAAHCCLLLSVSLSRSSTTNSAVHLGSYYHASRYLLRSIARHHPWVRHTECCSIGGHPLFRGQCLSRHRLLGSNAAT